MLSTILQAKKMQQSLIDKKNVNTVFFLIMFIWTWIILSCFESLLYFMFTSKYNPCYIHFVQIMLFVFVKMLSEYLRRNSMESIKHCLKICIISPPLIICYWSWKFFLCLWYGIKKELQSDTTRLTSKLVKQIWWFFLTGKGCSIPTVVWQWWWWNLIKL